MSSSSSISALKTSLLERGITSPPPDSLLEAILSIENNNIERASKTILDDLIASGVTIPSSSSSTTSHPSSSSYSSRVFTESNNSRRRINGMNYEGIGSGSSSSRPGNGAGLNPFNNNSNSNGGLNPIFYLLTLPFSLASSLLSFLLRLLGLRSILPYLGLSDNTSSSGRRRRGIKPPRNSIFCNPKDSARKWITDLEDLVGGKCNPSSLPISNEDHQSIGNQTDSYDRIRLPPFEKCSYKEAVEAAKSHERGQILCVVLTSEEHEDVEDFKRNTLTYGPLVELLSGGQFICWGGDVKEQEAWDVSNLLQASTYPFVAFISLRPTPTLPTSSSSSINSTSSQLSILSRHEGPSSSSSSSSSTNPNSNEGPTSGIILQNHLSTILLPRVSPFLNRIKNQALIRLEERRLRKEQDEAYERASRLDSERILKSRKENEMKLKEERNRKESLDLETRRKKLEKENRKREKKSFKESIGSKLSKDYKDELARSSGEKNRYSDLNFTLPSGKKLNKVFKADDSLDQVFAFVEFQSSRSSSDDSISSTYSSTFNGSSNQTLEDLTSDHQYTFTLLTGYPRRRISLQDQGFKGKKIEEIEGLVPAARVLVEGKVDEEGWEEESEDEEDEN